MKTVVVLERDPVGLRVLAVVNFVLVLLLTLLLVDAHCCAAC